jgi:hypothetical protein
MDEYRRANMSKLPGVGKNPVIKTFREERWPTAHNVRNNSKIVAQNKKAGDIDIEGPLETFTK